MQKKSPFTIFNELNFSLKNSKNELFSDRFVEFNSDLNIILFKKLGSKFAYAISFCLNKKLNETFAYINLVKLNGSVNFEKVISVGSPIPYYFINLLDIEVPFNYRILGELEKIIQQF